MKTQRFNIVVAGLISLILAMLVIAVIYIIIGIRTPPPKPLLMKNGPGPYFVVFGPRPTSTNTYGSNLVTVTNESTFGAMSYSGTPANAYFQGHLVKVIESGNALQLTNMTNAIGTHFEVPQNSGYFDGDEVLALKSVPDYWHKIDFRFSGTSYSADGTKDALLLILGKTEVDGQSFEGALALTVASGTNEMAATNYCNPIEGWNDAVVAGQDYTFKIWASSSTNLPTDMKLKAYIVNVANTNTTNGGTVTTNLYLPSPTGNLGSFHFVSGSGRYVGNNIALTPGTNSPVTFQLKSSAVSGKQGFHLIFVGKATNSYGTCETSIVFPIGPIGTTN